MNMTTLPRLYRYLRYRWIKGRRWYRDNWRDLQW